MYSPPFGGHLSNPSRMRVASLALVALAGIAGPTALAQNPITDSATVACLRQIPPTAFVRVPVYGYVQMDAASKAARHDAENFLPDVADALVRILHGTPDVLPPADSVLSWGGVTGSVHVTAFPDGRMTWSGDANFHDGTGLLVRALQAARAAGARVPILPDAHGATPDSVSFWLSTVSPRVDHTGKSKLPAFEGTALPLFSRAVPWMEPVASLPLRPQLRFPPGAGWNGYEATVIEDYVVDTTGRADSSSIHEEWPTDTPYEHDSEGYLREFVAAVRANIVANRFTPARIGGCAFSQQVRQGFVFSIRLDL